MKALLIGVTNNLVGGDGHSVELTEARNQSWKPQDLVGLLWVRWVSYGRDS